MGELTEVQAEAILNMRLRSLRRLEELELLRERDALMEERADLEDLLADEGLQWDRIADELREVRKTVRRQGRGRRAAHPIRRGGRGGGGPARGDDRPRAGDDRLLPDGLDPRHEGPYRPGQELKYRDGDTGRFVFHAETTDKLLLVRLERAASTRSRRPACPAGAAWGSLCA
jgi:topoisomerase-4 subunit A